MAAAQTVGHIKGVATAPVYEAFRGPERVAASVAVVAVQETSAAEIQLAGTLPVIGKLGAMQRIMGGPTGDVHSVSASKFWGSKMLCTKEVNNV